MEIRAMRNQIYKEPYTTVKFINTFHSSVFKNRNIKNTSSCKRAVILITREDNLLTSTMREQYTSVWEEKFNRNIFIYKQNQKPDFKEAVFISKIIMERIKTKTFEEVFIGFKTHKNNKYELVLLEILPVNKSLSFLIPKYIESIIFGILLEAFASY
jgi:F0F1-type ATP synthase gamma subunit